LLPFDEGRNHRDAEVPSIWAGTGFAAESP
jgi:hypothetical protein